MGKVLEDVLLQATNICEVGLEVMAMEVFMQGGCDGWLIVMNHPEELLELPFAPGEGFGKPGLEGGSEGCIGV